MVARQRFEKLHGGRDDDGRVPACRQTARHRVGEISFVVVGGDGVIGDFVIQNQCIAVDIDRLIDDVGERLDDEHPA